MRSYVKRVKQKAEKLSKEQVLSLLETMVEENESLYSVLESLSTGLLIINDDFQLLRYNTIVAGCHLQNGSKKFRELKRQSGNVLKMKI